MDHGEEEINAPTQAPLSFPKFGSFKPPAPGLISTKPQTAEKEEERKRLLSKDFEPRERHRSSRREHSEDRKSHKRRKHGREKDFRRREDVRRKPDQDEHGERKKHRSERSEAKQKTRHNQQDALSTAASVIVDPLPTIYKPSNNQSRLDDLAPSEFFSIDTKGDPANLIYGTIHRYSIPLYYRAGKGRVLGLPMNIRIIQDKGDGKGLVLGDTNDPELRKKRRGGPHPLAAIADGDSLRRLKVREVTNPGKDFEAGLEYISITSRKRKRKRGEAIDDHDNESDDDNDVEISQSWTFDTAGANTVDDKDLEYGPKPSSADRPSENS